MLVPEYRFAEICPPRTYYTSFKYEHSNTGQNENSSFENCSINRLHFYAGQCRPVENCSIPTSYCSHLKRSTFHHTSYEPYNINNVGTYQDTVVLGISSCLLTRRSRVQIPLDHALFSYRLVTSLVPSSDKG